MSVALATGPFLVGLQGQADAREFDDLPSAVSYAQTLGLSFVFDLSGSQVSLLALEGDSTPDSTSAGR